VFGRLNPDTYKVLAKPMFTGMRSKEFEDWVHSNVGENYVFSVCQQGMAGLRRLKASESLPSVKLWYRRRRPCKRYRYRTSSSRWRVAPRTATATTTTTCDNCDVETMAKCVC
jgi:hypothetical protein